MIWKNLVPVIILIFAMILDGCGDDDSAPAPEPKKTAEIFSIDPTQGPFDQEVTIVGKNFKVDTALAVSFNGKVAEIISATSTQIIVKVPRGAGPGKVIVTSDGKGVEGSEFVYQLTPIITLLAGSGKSGSRNGTGRSAEFNNPVGIEIEQDGSVLVADWANNKIRAITPEGRVSIFADLDGKIKGRIFDFKVLGAPEDDTRDVRLVSFEGHAMYYGFIESNDITISNSAGTPGNSGYKDGIQEGARFSSPRSINLLSDKPHIVDRNNHCIRLVEAGIVKTIAGDGDSQPGFLDGTGADARFNTPSGADMDEQGNLYVADQGNHAIRKITPSGEVTTIAGIGVAGFKDGSVNQAQFDRPRAVAVDGQGNLYVADFGNNRIRMITVDAQVVTLAGSDEKGFVAGVGIPDHPSGRHQALINGPNDLIVDNQGNVYISEVGNHAIRKIAFE